MKRIHLLLLALLALFAGAPFRAAAEETFRDRVVVIPVGEDSLTSKQSFGFMNRILKRAQEEQARAVIFDLNTPGGLAWETSEMMMKSIQPLTIPTYAYVNPRAMSAGALISAACDKIYMAPVSSIGAAGIITSSGEEMDPVMRKKAESAFWAFTRSVVTEKGYRPEVVKSHDDPVRPGTAVRPRQTGKRRAPDPDGQGSRRASGRRQAPAGPGHSLLRHGPAGPGESKCPRSHGGTYGL